MPEGDTLYRAAVVLRKVLNGTTITKAAIGRNPRDDWRFDADTLVNHSVDDVESRGKHLLMHLDNDFVIHSHLGMTGSWHTYRIGDRWRKPARQAALLLENGSGRQVVLFSPKTLELLSPAQFRRHRWLTRLGPDILASTIGTEEIVQRFRCLPDDPIGAAILNQTVVCGIGNVYKSEVLFLERVNPFSHVRDINDPSLTNLVQHTRDLMFQNLSGAPRTTRLGNGGSRKWVYGRSGEPCFVCTAPIQMRRQGDLGRSTYFCSNCQQCTRSR